MFDENDSDEPVEFTINQKYATSYGRWREKEELQKLKDRYGEDVQESDENSSESESDSLEDLDTKTDKTFLSVLSSLKAKDPAIYDNKVKFFPDAEDEPQENKETTKISMVKSKEKPLYLRDYERKLITEKEGRPVDENDEQNIDQEAEFDSYTYTEKQRKLKESFKKISNGVNDDGEDEFLRPRIKTEAQKKTEDEDYLEWLKGRKDTINESENVRNLQCLHDFWNQPDLDEGEKFLKDFILNKRYKSTEDDEQELPTYNDIVGESEELHVDFEEEEKLIEAQEQFEHKYNFRFEEPDEDFVKSYPRTIKDSLRRKDEKNKSKRDAYKERKAKEREQKTQEIKRLKSLKRKEIAEKLAKIREITGEHDLPLDPDEFDRDFDPTDYDQKMKKMFDDGYYSKTELDEEKPVFSNSSDDETDEDNMDNMVTSNSSSTVGAAVGVQSQNSEEHEETTVMPEIGVAVDAVENTGSKRKRRKHSKFLEVISKKKPLFDPNEKTVQQYFDEYYKLDYEDIIGGGDTVCRFKYRKVTPNDFGLSIDEILAAKPKELNAWVSVKKMSQYRPESDEVYDVNAYKTKAENLEKKKRLLHSVYHDKSASDEEDNDAVTPGPSTSSSVTTPALSKASAKAAAARVPESSCSNKVAKKRKRKGGARHVGDNNVDAQMPQKLVVNKAKNFRPSGSGGVLNQLSDDRLKAYGINPKKIRNKIKYANV